MSPRRWKLRTQLAAAMIVAIGLAILFGYVGLNLYAHWEEARALRALDPGARAALQAVREGRGAPINTLVDLCRTTMASAARMEREQDRVLIVLACLASAVGVGVGMTLARRLARPIEAVSYAARAIASGDLGARAQSRGTGAGELTQLLSDFNSMAGVLEAYDRDVRESSAAIAHELRTPLTILRGRLQGQLDGVFSFDAAEVRALIVQVDLLSHIVEDLRTLSLAQTGQLELQSRQLDLAVLLDELLDSLRSHLASAGLELRTDLGTALVYGDELRLKQVATILAENVVRHAASGGEIYLATGTRDAEVFLEVGDRGPGLPTEAGRLFERFWRGEPSRNKAHGGTGLGLAIARAVVEAHAGTIEARTRGGGGALFSVSFPRCSAGRK